jgi:hypothetical protein
LDATKIIAEHLQGANIIAATITDYERLVAKIST